LNLENKIILIDFWYRGCIPCLRATPELIKIQEEFKKELIIIGINDRDDQDDITTYLEYKKANYYSTYKTTYNISKDLKIDSFPTYILVDLKGNIKYIGHGFNKKEIRKSIKKLVQEKNT